MRLDFQLKALGHWSHLYSRSSVWTIMCCSKLCTEDGNHYSVHLPGRGGPLPYMACSLVCGPLEAPSHYREIGVHANSSFVRSLGLGQRKKPVPEPPSLKATPHPSQPEAEWNPSHLLDDPNFRAKFGSDAVVHNYKSNTQEAEAGHPVPHIKTLS